LSGTIFIFQVKEYPMTKESSPKTAKKKWVKYVTTDSTHPPHDLFTKSAPAIARSLASRKVSPKGAASGMRMLTYYINRAGKNLSASRKEELERAKQLLSKKIEQEKQAT
jgi:hypothetical protein